MIERVLWATDFSPESEAALRWAEMLSGAFGAQLVMAHAVPDILLFYNTLLAEPDAWLRVLEDAKAEARNRLALMAEAKGATYYLLEGSPYREMVALAERIKASLVVMGWGGETGQTSIKVARKAPCPVLVVKRGTEPSLKHILYTTDLSEESAQVLPWVKLLAGKFGSRVTALHVMEAKGHLPPDEEKLLVESVSKAIPTPEGLPAEARVEVAPKVSEGVRRVVEEEGVDLVAVASHGRSGLARVLMGSVAERILSEVPTPLLVVRVK